MGLIWLSTSQPTSSTSTTLWSATTRLRTRLGVLTSTRLYIIPLFAKKTLVSQLLWFKCTETPSFRSWLNRRREATLNKSRVTSETAQQLSQLLTQEKLWLQSQRNTPGIQMCRLSHQWSKQWWRSHRSPRTFQASKSIALSSSGMILWLLTLKKIYHNSGGATSTRAN